MQAESDESRQVIYDIDLFRMQMSYYDGDQPQLAPTLSSNSSTYGSTNSSNYGYRSRDEVANAILTLLAKKNKLSTLKRKVLRSNTAHEVLWKSAKKRKS